MNVTRTLFIPLTLASSLALAEDTVINGLDFGPLAQLVGTWQSTEQGGTDLAPGQAGSAVGKGGAAVEPFYEVLTFEVAADATNASDQHLVALYYKQEVYKKSTDAKFHDQRGYLIYDKANNSVYNSYCIPRAVCVVAEATAGNVMNFTTKADGIAQSEYMTKNAATTGFTMTLTVNGDDLSYSQATALNIYGKPFAHVDSSKLTRVK